MHQPEKPEAGCHLSPLLYATSFICFDVLQSLFPKQWLRTPCHLFRSCLLFSIFAGILAEYKALFSSHKNSISFLFHFINKSMYGIVLQKPYQIINNAFGLPHDSVLVSLPSARLIHKMGFVSQCM